MRTLPVEPNPLSADDPFNTPQPRRERPRQVCAHGERAIVTLSGTDDEPGTRVALVDLPAPPGTPRVVRTLELGASPWGCAIDPTGQVAIVTLRISDRALVLDFAGGEVLERVPVPYYTESVLFAPDGGRVYFTNRWKDAVLAWDLNPGDVFALRGTNYAGRSDEAPMGTPVGDNPGPMALSADGRRLFVGSVGGMSVAVLDARTLDLIDTDDDPATTTPGAPAGVTHIEVRSPVGGLAMLDPYLFIADIGRGTGSEAAAGRDLDGDGEPGDGTANVVFQDLQNEIGVVDTRTYRERHRYTSDTICCRDFRDVDPDRPAAGLELPAPDTWPPETVARLPPRASWIVAGALPEAMVAFAEGPSARSAGRLGQLYVAYAGSNEVQGFDVDDSGGLRPRAAAGELFRTGMNPRSLALVAGPHPRLVTADRLADGLTLIDPQAPPGSERRLSLAPPGVPAFPATDAELGEAINDMTAAFTIDGDQTCAHCHRDSGAIGRAVVMPLQTDRRWSARNIMAQRGLADTRPWFFESAMNEANFFPVLNEFARRENFCCERLDPRIWTALPALEACLEAPDAPGCEAVLDCEHAPPETCASLPYGGGASLRRRDHMLDAAQALLGRRETFGDALYEVGLDGTRQPIPLDFEGVTRAVGLFMLRTPRLPPNPNRALELPSARRGRLLYEDPTVGCALCHPLPTTTTSGPPGAYSPAGMPVRFPPVISPERTPEESDALHVTAGFISTFPETRQSPAGLHMGATPLRGLWDRPQRGLLHDGRAASLREVLCPPGHPALLPGETGHNERDGVVDTHGGTSLLDSHQLDDLMHFVRTL